MTQILYKANKRITESMKQIYLKQINYTKIFRPLRSSSVY